MRSLIVGDIFVQTLYNINTVFGVRYPVKGMAICTLLQYIAATKNTYLFKEF